MKKALNPQEAYEKAAAYCVRREHCLKDVQHKLYEWGVERSLWDSILDKLVERSFIDEARFARAFARDKHLYSAWGRVRIKQELKARGLSSALIEQALNELFDEYEEDEQLMRTLESKMRSLKAQDPEHKKREQLVRFAMYRGYPYDSIRRALSKMRPPDGLKNDK